MHTKKIFSLSTSAILVFIMMLNISIFAQQRGGDRPPQVPNNTQVEKMVQELSEQLSLTNDQTIKVESIFKNHFSEMRSLMNNGERIERAEMESIKAEFESEVKSVLNDDQIVKFDEFMKKMQPQKRSRR